MIKQIKEAIHHLKVETGWSYWYHLWHSICNSARLIAIAFKSVVHGLIPSVWKADAPKEVIRMYHEIMRIEHIKKMDKLRELPKDERYTNKDIDPVE
tara:strand:+ start:831 stop:1121 length:291 start_codon:yes stop_codon:yes gene_type:complete